MVGRKAECERLHRCMEASEAQLVAIYGRRRVGKTNLVNRYFGGRFDFKLTGIYGQPKEMQLRNFITELNNQSGIKHDVPRDWQDAFSLLKEYLETRFGNEKVIVFFDEMPWMDTPKSGFIHAFEWFWNGWGNAKNDLIFIVCGSAASWMNKNLEHNKGGLYNRLTARLYIKPFSLRETEEYLQSKNIEWSRYDIVESYMIMGGIPYYLSLLSPDLSYTANIDNLFFRKRAELWDEFSFLYESLFSNGSNYVKIVEALSKKRSGLSREEVMRAASLPDNGLLTEMLNNLEYSGFVRINDNYGSKRKTYQLSDYYTVFYFRFIKGRYGKDEHYWTNTIDDPSRRAWAGLTFEQVCHDHVDQIKYKLGISGMQSSVSVWSIKGDGDVQGAQIDMLIDRRDRVINICEAKYTLDEYEIDEEKDRTLRNKIETFRRTTGTKSALQLVMLTTYGVRKNKYSGIVTGQVTLEDLFA